MTTDEELDALISEVTVDCYDTDEQSTAFAEAFNDQIDSPAPATATILGLPVQVRAVHIAGTRTEITAHCAHEQHRGDIAIADLTFGDGTGVAYVHAAYRRFLGVEPRPATRPAGWSLSWQ
ncbi:MAG: hypothetical protein ACRDWT_07660 [Jatrophihabitantaceae bacterium]